MSCKTVSYKQYIHVNYGVLLKNQYSFPTLCYITTNFNAIFWGFMRVDHNCQVEGICFEKCGFFF